MKVGFIKEIEKHPDADKLYVSKIITKSEPEEILTVCSGLVDYIPREELFNKKVVLITNLKPSKMRGIKSEAMLLAADDPKTVEVEVVNAPINSEIGDELTFNGIEEITNKSRLKSKIWEELQKNLITNSEGQVIFKGEKNDQHILNINNSPAFVKKLINCSVR